MVETVAAPAPPPAPSPTAAKPAEAAAQSDAAADIARNYCLSIASPAAEARLKRQRQELNALKADVQKRIAALDAKIVEHKSWLERFDAFAGKARDSLVGIYASMKPEAAAKQIAEIDEETAAAVIQRLDTRQSGAILTDMDSKKAARLMQLIAGSAQSLEEAAVGAAGLPGVAAGGALQPSAAAAPDADDPTAETAAKPAHADDSHASPAAEAAHAPAHAPEKGGH